MVERLETYVRTILDHLDEFIRLNEEQKQLGCYLGFGESIRGGCKQIQINPPASQINNPEKRRESIRILFDKQDQMTAVDWYAYPNSFPKGIHLDFDETGKLEASRPILIEGLDKYFRLLAKRGIRTHRKATTVVQNITNNALGFIHYCNTMACHWKIDDKDRSHVTEMDGTNYNIKYETNGNSSSYILEDQPSQKELFRVSLRTDTDIGQNPRLIEVSQRDKNNFIRVEYAAHNSPSKLTTLSGGRPIFTYEFNQATTPEANAGPESSRNSFLTAQA